MNKTHLSFYYLVSYLTIAGVGLIALPEFTLKLFFSNGNYGDVMPRLLGVVLLALGIVISQIVRHHVEVLYTTTLVVRALILAVLAGLYFYARDPLFIALFLVVGFGVVLTAIGYWLDRQSASVRTPSRM